MPQATHSNVENICLRKEKYNNQNKYSVRHTHKHFDERANCN